MMRRTMESVAAERLNILGVNPNIISNRQDLKIDQEALKDLVAKSTPNPSRSSSEEDINQSRTSKVQHKINHNSNTKLENLSDDESARLRPKSFHSPIRNKIKITKSNLQVNIPNILKKSPSTPSKLFYRKNSTTPDPNV